MAAKRNRLANYNYNVKEFGAVGDGVTDDTAAFEAALTAVATAGGAVSRDNGYPGSMINRYGKLFMPRGQYKITRTLHISRAMVLEGEGGLGWFPATELLYPDAVPGIVVDYGVDSFHPSGGGSLLRNFGMKSPGTSSTSAHAIELEAAAQIEDVSIWRFGGNGIHIQAGFPARNANNFRIHNCSVYYCKNGIYTQGNDANAGVVQGCDLSYCSEYGVYETSFLGNNYIGNHSSNCTLGAYYAAGAVNCSVFVANYAESGNPGHSEGEFIQWIGGVLQDFDSTSSAITYKGGKFTGEHKFKSGNATYPIYVHMGGDAASGATTLRPMSLEVATRIVALQYDATTGWWSLGSDQTNPPFEVSDQSATEGAGKVRFRSGFYLGSGSNQRFHDRDSAAPTTGAHIVGDVVWNVNPVAGGWAGWICTTAGTPGTWKTFGAIAA